MRSLLLLVAAAGVLFGVSLGISTWNLRQRIISDAPTFNMPYIPQEAITPEILEDFRELNTDTPEAQEYRLSRLQPYGTATIAGSALIIVSSITLGAFAAKSKK